MHEEHIVPLMRPVHPDPEALLPRQRAMHRSGWFSNFGPQSRELEAGVATLLGVPAEHVVAVSNATAGLLGALSVLSAAHRWSLPSWTFTATAAAAAASGRELVFRDVDRGDWWLRSRPGAGEGVLRVAPFGVGFGPEVWARADEVVVDAAASLGADHRLTDMPGTGAVVYSLGATKVLGIGEGGVVVLGDQERAARLRSWTNFGFEAGRTSTFAGLNAKLSEPLAVIALTALESWPEERREWLAARRVADELSVRHGLSLAPGLAGGVSPYWIIELNDVGSRAVFEQVLAQHGVATRRWWSAGCHRMPAYDAVARDPLPVTEHLADTVLGLPMYRGLSDDDADRIDIALKDACSRVDPQ